MIYGLKADVDTLACMTEEERRYLFPLASIHTPEFIANEQIAPECSYTSYARAVDDADFYNACAPFPYVSVIEIDEEPSETREETAPMEAIDIRYPTPTIRVELHYDEDCQNPLTNWDHGVEFRELPNASSVMSRYTDIDQYSNVYEPGHPLDIDDWENYREFWEDSWREPYQNAQTAPSLKTFLNRHCAAWGTVDRDGYTGELHFYLHNTDFESSDGIAFVSRANFLQGWHGKPEGTRLTKRLRTMAEEGIQAVIDEYNNWARGDCYGIIVEVHNSACPYCDDANDPDEDCPCWDNDSLNYDSGWGMIGYDYAREELDSVCRSIEQECQPCSTPS